MKRQNNVILHIGCHKTGTTWLQKCFFNRLEGIRLYARPKDMLTSFPDYYPDRILLISHENISESLPYQDVENQMNNMLKYKDVYPNAKIIIATRNFNTWIHSCYSQSLRDKFYYTFDEFMQKYKNCHDTLWFKHVAEVLWGCDNVYSYTFEDFCSDKHKVLTEICEFIGVKMPIYEDKRLNTSLKHLELHRAINITMRMINTARLRLIK